MNRRAYLASIVGGSVVAAGCLRLGGGGGPTNRETDTPTPTPTPTPLPPVSQYDVPIEPDPSFDPTAFDGHVRPDGYPQTVPDALHCENELFERRVGFYRGHTGLQWGDLTNDEGEKLYEMRVDALTVEFGDTVNIVLTNVSDERGSLGHSGKSDLEVFTEAGWQDPRGWSDGLSKPVPGLLYKMPPGEYYHWTYKLTDDGVVRGEPQPGGFRETLVTCPELPAGRYRFVCTAPDAGNVAVAFDLVT